MLSSNFYRMLASNLGFYTAPNSTFLWVGEFRNSFLAGEYFDYGDVFMFLLDCPGDLFAFFSTSIFLLYSKSPRDAFVSFFSSFPIFFPSAFVFDILADSFFPYFPDTLVFWFETFNEVSADFLSSNGIEVYVLMVRFLLLIFFRRNPILSGEGAFFLWAGDEVWTEPVKLFFLASFSGLYGFYYMTGSSPFNYTFIYF